MDSLAVDVVKEFLKANGLTRTLRTFEAAMLANGGGTLNPAAAKKAPKFESSLLSSDAGALPRLEQMLGHLRPSAPPNPARVRKTATAAPSETPVPRAPSPPKADVSALIQQAMQDVGPKRSSVPVEKPRARGRREEVVIVDESDDEPPVRAPVSKPAPVPPVIEKPPAKTVQSGGSWFTEPEPTPVVAPKQPSFQREQPSESLGSEGVFMQARRAPATSALPQKISDKVGPAKGLVEDLIVDDADDVEVEYGSAPRSSAAASASGPVAAPVAISKSLSGGSAGFPSTGTPITEAQAVRLRQLLTGADKMPLPSFHKSWHQGFFYSSEPGLGYGLIQPEGGPCGVLAAVQAFTLRHLFWNESPSVSLCDAAGGWKQPSPERQQHAVIRAIRDIIWRAVPSVSGIGRRNYAVLAVPGSKPHFPRTAAYPPDGLTETLLLQRCLSIEALQAAIEASIAVFTEQRGPGIPLVVYSVLLTRGIDGDDGVLSDMDQGFGACSMIGRHNYATQELVNLLLYGQAHSNVFDGTHSLPGEKPGESIVLRGTPFQGEVGFLSLFENYGNIEVGALLKNPVFPVWVLCSESHYSCLFAPSDAALNSRTNAAVDLFYFDGLGRQNEEIRLTVDPAPEPPLDPEECKSEDNPPIDLCVRTRWRGASVDWNGVEPLL